MVLIFMYWLYVATFKILLYKHYLFQLFLVRGRLLKFQVPFWHKLQFLDKVIRTARIWLTGNSSSHTVTAWIETRWDVITLNQPKYVLFVCYKLEFIITEFVIPEFDCIYVGLWSVNTQWQIQDQETFKNKIF